MRDYIKEFKERFDGTKYKNNEGLYHIFRFYGEVGERFLSLVEQNDLNVWTSPYSQSVYAFDGDEEITWGYKPEGSYRIADHWNFDGHCITECGTQQELMICKFENGIYQKI